VFSSMDESDDTSTSLFNDNEEGSSASPQESHTALSYIVTSHGDILWSKKRSKHNWSIFNLFSEKWVFYCYVIISATYSIIMVAGIGGLIVGLSSKSITSLSVQCDDLCPSDCLLPFPNNHFLVDDSSTPTGKRLALLIDSMPKTVRAAYVFFYFKTNILQLSS
jgi:hypothetical protein